MDADRTLSDAFYTAKSEATYSNISNLDLICRYPGITLESLAFSSDQRDADHSTALPNVPGGKEE